MAPMPLEQSGHVHSLGSSGPTIPLSTLIEYVVQRTFHELTLLSELLLQKQDMERKIEIVQFANRTRILFIRLLALVKWASSASKVDTCGKICSFLDQQAMLFIDTANMLAKMTRETLVQARLPTFSLPSAIDVLTTGTYPRLPTCIKEKIIPPDAITPTEKDETLRRLDQIIEHRLVITSLPRRFCPPAIVSGRVTLRVKHEFQVSLTLMGEEVSIPWRLLQIQILVEDPETGDGKVLVHSRQVEYLHGICQARLLNHENPLHDLYDCLHSFCQSLQLEVLHSQAERLKRLRIGNHIRIKEYMHASRLVIVYWVETGQKPENSFFPLRSNELHIHVDESDKTQPLQILHQPAIRGYDSIKVAEAIKSDHLSFEKLLVFTIEVRSLAKLRDIERKFEMMISGKCELRQVPALLYVPVLHPCMSNELLVVSVDPHRGTFCTSIDLLQTNTILQIQESLNDDCAKLSKHLSQLRIDLTLKRVTRSVDNMTYAVFSKPPLLLQAPDHSLEKLSANKVFIRLPKQQHFYLLVEVVAESGRTVDINYFLLSLEPVTQSQKLSLKPGYMAKLSSFGCTHPSGSTLYPDLKPYETDIIKRKRKMIFGDGSSPTEVKSNSHYFLPEVSTILSLCEDRVPFMMLSQELASRGIYHEGVRVDPSSAGFVLGLLDALPCPDISLDDFEAIRLSLQSCKIRVQKKIPRSWLVESTFSDTPVKSKAVHEQEKIRRVLFTYEFNWREPIKNLVNSLLDDWSDVVHLYALVREFSVSLTNDKQLRMALDVITYTYKRLVLAYGPNKCYTATFQYHRASKSFVMTLGTSAQAKMANPHCLTLTSLQQLLNSSRSITVIVKILIDTWHPLVSLGHLSATPIIGLNKQNMPSLSFALIVQSYCRVRLIFRDTYCIDIELCSGGKVTVRDGAYGIFDCTKVTPMEAMNPILGLRGFLALFEDKQQLAVREGGDDEVPQSPVTIDSSLVDPFMAQQIVSVPSGKSTTESAALRYNPMTPPSNPHTPASPHLQQSVSSIAPSPSNFVAPSPNNLLTQESPSALHVPSPGGFAAPSPHTNQGSSFMSPQPVASPMPPPSPRMAQSPRMSLQTASSGLSSSRSAALSHGWSASLPTTLSHEALRDFACVSAEAPQSKLERFLCCTYLRRTLTRIVGNEEKSFQSINGNDSLVTIFKAEKFQVQVMLDRQTQLTLVLKVTPLPEFADVWSAEELRLIERFFEKKVASPPYRTNNMTAFCKLIGATTRILKDFVQIMRLELMPDPSLKWSLQWCLTLPQDLQSFGLPPGTPAVHISEKVFFMLQLNQVNQGISRSLSVPILYNNNQTQIVSANQAGARMSPEQNQATQTIRSLLQSFSDRSAQRADQACSMYPAIKELVTTLTL